jgi:hypothetical protein
MYYKRRNAGLFGIWSVGHRNEQNANAGNSPTRNNQSGTGMLQYRTEIPDVGMLIPAASPAKLRWMICHLQRFRTDSFCLPSKLRTRHKRFLIVVFLSIIFAFKVRIFWKLSLLQQGDLF